MTVQRTVESVPVTAEKSSTHTQFQKRGRGDISPHLQTCRAIFVEISLKCRLSFQTHLFLQSQKLGILDRFSTSKLYNILIENNHESDNQTSAQNNWLSDFNHLLNSSFTFTLLHCCQQLTTKLALTHHLLWFPCWQLYFFQCRWFWFHPL